MIWKGWTESAFARSPPLCTSTGGFTAINTAQHVSDASTGPTNAQSKNNSTIIPVASANGIHPIPATGSKIVDIPWPGASQKKRKIGSGNASKPKRQKSNEISGSMNVGKSCTAVNKAATLCRRDNTTRSSSKEEPPKAVLITPISLFASSTSMTSMKPVGQTMSLGSSRTSSVHRHTFDASLLLPDLQQTGVEYSRPWLNTVSAKPDPRVLNSANPHESQRRTPSSISDEGFNDIDSGSLEQHSESVKTRTQSVNASVSDFFTQSDDEFDEQAIRLTDALSTAMKTSPVNSDAYADKRQVVHQLRTPGNLDLVSTSRNVAPAESNHLLELYGSDEVDLIEEKVDLTSQLNVSPDLRDNQEADFRPARTAKQNMREVAANENYGGALLTKAEKKLLDERASTYIQGGPVPLARSPFPSCVLDRSPVFGASSCSSLRTCFRIGEALNVGCQSIRLNNSVVLELYARVLQSWREARQGHRQHFVFGDLYHDNPPQIPGTFDLWNQSPLWDHDSRPFLTTADCGRMCRVIAIMKRDEEAWRLEVLSIWTANWEDINHVAGIYRR